jgi:hypothetical protein
MGGCILPFGDAARKLRTGNELDATSLVCVQVGAPRRMVLLQLVLQPSPMEQPLQLRRQQKGARQLQGLL